MIVDSIGVTYNTLEELVERQNTIENKLSNFLSLKKGSITRYETRVDTTKHNKFILHIDLIED